jgi:diguanylate cyclase (GGDEF)-like protein
MGQWRTAPDVSVDRLASGPVLLRRSVAGNPATDPGSVALDALERDPLECDAAALEGDSLDPATLRSINARLRREIAMLKQREANALKLADRDGLTGLYNRRRMTELLTEEIAQASRLDSRLGVLFIDLDGFKRVNDQHGHAAGDELLMTVAGRIATRTRTGDAVCRYGGDEFIVLLPRIPDRAAALEVAASIGSLVALPIKVAGEELRVSAAVGVSMYPEDGRTAARLLQRADDLMYRAKAGMGGAPHGPAARSAPTRRRDDKSKRRID